MDLPAPMQDPWNDYILRLVNYSNIVETLSIFDPVPNNADSARHCFMYLM